MAHIRSVPLEEATGELEDVYSLAKERSGRVLNAVKAQGLHPAALAASFGLYDVLMHGDKPLSRAEREMIAVAVSGANNCDYGIQAHLRELATVTDDQDLINTLGRDYRLARVDERQRAMLDFAVLVTKDVHLVSRVTVLDLMRLGLTQEEVLLVVQITSFVNYENRLVDALGVEPDDFMPR